MTEVRHYLLLCPSNYFSLRMREVPDESNDPSAFPCPMVDHGTHDLVRIDPSEYYKRVRINAPNAGTYAAGVDTGTVEQPAVAPQPGDEPPARDVLGNVYEPPTPIPDPQQAIGNTGGQVEGAVSPDQTIDPPTQP